MDLTRSAIAFEGKFSNFRRPGFCRLDSFAMAPRFSFYAVANGRNTGIYSSWDECKKQVDGYANAKFKKFGTKMEALDFIREHDQLKVCTKVILKKKQEYERRASTKSGDGYERNTAGFVVVYTDGACSNNNKRSKALAGYGVFWNVDHPANESGPVTGEQTNNRGEVTAVIRAIEIAMKNGLDALCVRTDSQFLIDSMTKWVKGWRKNGWKTVSGEPVKNIELMKRLDELTQSIRVVYEKVPAHSGVYGNEMADRLATQAVKKAKKQKQTN
ncbi:unnamed protein product, partial [Mesorhabditis belari]|uniref:Ribonuclease H1 n=1 Tax=Mesorhabditis belari TaxID=2138241 RepID=A0AAF3FHU0_9BILA